MSNDFWRGFLMGAGLGVCRVYGSTGDDAGAQSGVETLATAAGGDRALEGTHPKGPGSNGPSFFPYAWLTPIVIVYLFRTRIPPLLNSHEWVAAVA